MKHIFKSRGEKNKNDMIFAIIRISRAAKKSKTMESTHLILFKWIYIFLIIEMMYTLVAVFGIFQNEKI